MSINTLNRTSAETSAVPLVRPFAQISSLLSPFAEPLLRATAGLLLVPHGAQKLFGWFGGHGLDATGQFFASKFGLPTSFALLAGLIEFAGGFALALGFLTRPVAVLVAAVMAVAVVQVHLPAGFIWTAGGYEYPLLWGVVALFFAIRGGGRLSVDAMIGREF